MKKQSKKDRVIKFNARHVSLEVRGDGNVYAPNDNGINEVAIYRKELIGVVAACDKVDALIKEREKIEQRLGRIDDEITDAINKSPEYAGDNYHDITMDVDDCEMVAIGCKKATSDEARRLLKVCNAMVSHKGKAAK